MNISNNSVVLFTDPPLNVSVEMSYLGHLKISSSVNLTCSSAANPAAYSYTWFRGANSSFSSMVQVGTGQVLSIPSVDVSHTGLYVCQAMNHLGSDNSTGVLLTLDDELDSVYTGETGK